MILKVHNGASYKKSDYRYEFSIKNRNYSYIQKYFLIGGRVFASGLLQARWGGASFTPIYSTIDLGAPAREHMDACSPCHIYSGTIRIYVRITYVLRIYIRIYIYVYTTIYVYTYIRTHTKISN